MNISKKIGKITTLAILFSVVLGSTSYASAGIVDSIREVLNKPRTTEFEDGGVDGRLIWPHRLFDIRVVSPNGGEVWTKGKSYEIAWSVDYDNVTKWLENFQEKNKKQYSDLSVLPRHLQVQAYLVKKDGVTIYPLEVMSMKPNYYAPKGNSVFIGKANLFDKHMNWRIPNITEARDYKVRLVVTWPLVAPATSTLDKALYFPRIISDESDRPFSIVNPDRPTPEPIDIQALLIQIRELRGEINAMKESLSKMNQIINKIERIIEFLVR